MFSVVVHLSLYFRVGVVNGVTIYPRDMKDLEGESYISSNIVDACAGYVCFLTSI